MTGAIDTLSAAGRARLFRPLITAAIIQAESMPAADKADIYEGIACLSASFDGELAQHATRLAEAIRDSESLQLHFRNLFLPHLKTPTESE